MHVVSQPLILSRNAVVVGLATAFALTLAIALLSSSMVQRMALADAQAIRAKESLSATTRLLAALAMVEQAEELADEMPSSSVMNALKIAEQELANEYAIVRDYFRSRAELLPLLDQLERSAGGVWDGTASAGRLAMMRQVVHALQRHQFSALAEFSGAAANRARGIHHLIGAAVAIALLLGAAAAWLLFRGAQKADGLITVCAWTRRVLWQGRWISFEEYLARRFNLHCTHGICEEAAKSLRDEVPGQAGPAAIKRQ